PLRRPLQCGFPTRSWLQRREDPMRTLFPVIRGSWWIVCFSSLASGADDAAALRPHLVFYASFDEAVRGDFGGGVLLPSTRRDNPEVKGAYLDREGIDDKVFRIARGKGVHGGALEAADVLPGGGRIFFPAKGNLPYRPGGWGGAVSFWLNTDPNTLLKTPFCDP